MPVRRILALWETVHEPRVVTIVYMVLYAVAVLVGAAIIVDARHGILSGAPSWVVAVIVGLLMTGGGVGVPAAWRGDRWLEMPVVLAVGAAVTLLLLNATMLAPQILPLTVLLAALTTAAMVPRWMTVTSLTYAPGRGPLSPSDQAVIDSRQE